MLLIWLSSGNSWLCLFQELTRNYAAYYCREQNSSLHGCFDLTKKLAWIKENIVVLIVVLLTSITVFKSFRHERESSIYRHCSFDDDSIFPNDANEEEKFHHFYSKSMTTCPYNRLVLPPSCRIMKGTRRTKDHKHIMSSSCSIISVCYNILSFDYINMTLHFVCRVTNAFGHRWFAWKDMGEDAGDADEAHTKDTATDDDKNNRTTPSKKDLVGTRYNIDFTVIPDLPKLLPPLKLTEIKQPITNTDVDKSDTLFHMNHNQIQDFDKTISFGSISPKRLPMDGWKKGRVSPLHLGNHSIITNSVSSPTRKHALSIDLNFFDAASNDTTLKRIVRDVALPDKNGYVLGDEYIMDPKSDTPLLVFVNSKSGSQQGLMLKIQFRRLLNPIQVWDLSDGPPEPILSSFSVFSRLRILVCGGDGTVSWIISSLDKLKLQRWPPIAILPIGTGNDLARIHGWGGGFWGNENLITILNHVQDAYVSLLDRWQISIFEKKTEKCSCVKTFTNYMSIGSDAFSALQLHRLRQQSPNLFFSRILNKLYYALVGAEDAIRASCAGLHQNLTLIADGVEIPIPIDSQGLIFMNIDSYLGGCPLWARGVPVFRRGLMKKRRYNNEDDIQDKSSEYLNEEHTNQYLDDFKRITDCSSASSCQDGKIDVISYCGNFHLGQIRVGLGSAQLLCQCSELTIVLKKRLAIQIDGEPWRQDRAKIEINRKSEPAVMLHKTGGADAGTESILAEVLEWAEDQNIIDRRAHNSLMKEYSRRIEIKMRDRKTKSREKILGLSVISRT